MKLDALIRYANLLTGYCCGVKAGDRVLIRSTYLAEPLIVECQKKVLQLGATCEFDISLPKIGQQKYEYSSNDALMKTPILYKHSVESFDVIISISAPFDLFELKSIDKNRLALAQKGLIDVKSKMMQRGKVGDLRWVICNYPTQSLADAAKMSLHDYSNFIAEACFLKEHEPIKSWKQLSTDQKRYVDVLNKGSRIQFKSPHVDLSFDISDRIWINSDGKRNMPSGEVFTSPVETSGEGKITFDYPSLLFGEEVNDLTLTLDGGQIKEWRSPLHKDLFDELFKIKGANKVGEIAIGTNYAIKEPTLNTLFDEKIGGTIHMAVGASYPETGGKNQSSIHHDFVTSFTNNSEILIDNKLIYQNGKFIV